MDGKNLNTPLNTVLVARMKSHEIVLNEILNMNE